MKNIAETGASNASNESYRRPEPLVVEFGKPFSITPNLSTETIPPYAENVLHTDDGVLVDLVKFDVAESAISGGIEVLSLNLGIDDYHDNIVEPAGNARPYTLAVNIDGEATENSVGINLSYKGQEFTGLIDYSLSDEEELIGSVADNSWLDTKTQSVVYPIFQGSEISNVEFTISANPPSDEHIEAVALP